MLVLQLLAFKFYHLKVVSRLNFKARLVDYLTIIVNVTNKMYGNAGFLGLDFETGIANHFFLEWNAAMMNGAFRGDWSDHRHDMTCGSIIANRLGMKFQSGNELLEYAGPDDPVKNNTIIFKAQGI